MLNMIKQLITQVMDIHNFHNQIRKAQKTDRREVSVEKKGSDEKNKIDEDE